jgi:hypothetical protein
MKTSLAIVLTAVVLVSGATASPMSGTASAKTLGQIWCTKACPPQVTQMPTRQLRSR